jgi:hypothetical protein
VISTPKRHYLNQSDDTYGFAMFRCKDVFETLNDNIVSDYHLYGLFFLKNVRSMKMSKILFTTKTKMLSYLRRLITQ